MARLRFPGRPGHRFDRLSLRYFAEDIKNSQDPSLAFLPQFQHGLKSFRDIVGVSDEEDEFEGFTAKELKDGEKKLTLFNKEQQKKKEMEEQMSELVEPVEYRGKRLGKVRISLKSLPAPVRPGVKMKHVEKSNKILIEEKDKSPGKGKISSIKLKGSKLFDHRKKPKKFKLDYKHGLHDANTVGEKSKKSDMDMAKFLLEKAKQANKIQEQARARRLAAAKKSVQVQRKEFVLPTQSSRSSRVIKPNKRFLESDSVNTTVIKKSKCDEIVESPSAKLPDSTFKLEKRKSTDTFRPSFSNSQNSIGLLDQPLIVDGKRDRKPSLKLQMSDDESSLFSPTKSAMTSPLAAPKLGTSLFAGSQFQKASEKQKFSMMGFGASRLHGTSIVQKAKLQLNRAALNKSKAALARSLKAEMKREAKYAEQAKQHEVDTTTAATTKELGNVKGKKGRKKKCCAVCGKKTDLTICYEKILACMSCRRFYKECKWLINIGTFTKPNCMKNDKCKLIPDKIKCRLCRIKKALQVGFPTIPGLNELFEEEVKKVKKAVKVEEPIYVDVESCSPVVKKGCEIGSPSVKKGAEIGSPAVKKDVDIGSQAVKKGSDTGSSAVKKSLRKGTPVQSPIQKPETPSFILSPPPLPSTSENTPTKEQELSPVKAGEGSEKRQRKKRAFKELLRNKQDKVEEVEPVQEEKPVIQEPIPVVATGSVEISPSGGPGPRIKHVCRNAAVVLGQPLATFPEKSELRLSALPTKDKVQLWKKDEESKAANDDSDDDRPMEEIIQQSGDSVVIVKKSPARSKMGKKLTGAGGLHLYKRKMRCRNCPGCIRQDCGVCRHCLDMRKFGGPGTIKKACIDKPKFGGQGVLKQGCVERRCTNPLIKRSATEAFIVEKKKEVIAPKVERIRIVSESESQEEGQSDFAHSDNLEPVIPGSVVTRTVSGLETQTGTLLEDETQSNNNVSGKPNENLPTERGVKVQPEQTSYQTVDLEKQRVVTRGQSTTSKSHSSEVRKLTFEDIPNFQLERISSRNKESGKISSKLMKKLEIQEKYSKKEGGNDGQCYPVTLQSVLPASRQWGSLLSQPKYYPIKVDFKGKCDLGSAWNYGMALTMSSAMSVRALCFLCGSAGKHEMIYCNICCEPFHEFCLEDWEQPTPDHYDDWICAACQFCHVCGRQNNLLQCDKCQNTYHPGCLGPNYPTKPSKRKNIWICTKCVKCKSCGATTPGTDSQATWTYDFSLCFECGQLMDKGNFCPICRKCYSDDDWESKMIQCNMCESWVHSKCEGLTDEMYEILSYLPEDLSFYCRKCFPVGCPEWESTLKRELRLGLENILQSLILSKSSQYILKQEKKSPPKQPPAQPALLELPCHQTPEKQKKSCTLNNTINTQATQERVKRNMKSFEKIKQLLNMGSDKELTNGIGEDGNEENLVGESCENDHMNDNKLNEAYPIEIRDQTNDTNFKENHVAMETDNVSGDNPLSLTCDTGNIGDKSEVIEHVIQTVNNEKTKQVCDNDDNSDLEKGCPLNEGCPETKCCPSNKVCTTSEVVEDKAMICDNQTGSENFNNVEGCDKESEVNSKTEKKQCDNTNSDNALTSKSSELSKNEIIESEGIVNKVENNKKTENNFGLVLHSNGKGNQLSVTHTKLNANFIVENENVGSSHKGNMVSSVETQADEDNIEVVQKRNSRVHFNVEEPKNDPCKEQIKEADDNFPKDLMEIAQKMKTGEYKSVAIFCEDILRVIQTYLDNEEESRTSRKKATQSAKSIFAKQLEKVFPWFNVKTCRHWYSMRSLPDGMLPDATLPPNNDHTYAQWLERIEVPRSPQPSPFKRRTATPVKKYMPIDEEDYEPGQMFDGDDERKCMFCQTFGDQEANDAGRLLYCGQDDWCHINCALWSAEVYEDADGELQNIVEAFSRGKMLRCDLCGKAGATVGCNTKGCKSNYHFMCARRDSCRFQEDKKVFCKQHRMYIDAELLAADRFNVLRRAYVGTLFVRSVKKRWSKGLHCGDVSVLMGSCCVENLGRLTDLSDKPKFLQPVDFITTRMYWSTKDARRRCVYTCRIVEVRPETLKSPTVTIKDMRIVHDQNHPDFVPLSNLDLTGICSVSEQENLSILGTDSENPLVDLTSETADMTAKTEDITANMTSITANSVSKSISAEEQTMEIGYSKSELSLCKTTDFGCMERTDEITKRRASFSGKPSENTVVKESEKLSLSWPIGNRRAKDANFKQASLSNLSPQTLKMLNIKDPSVYMKPVQRNENIEEDQEEFSLIKVANRLNRAAAKSSRRNSDDRQSEGNSPLPLRSTSRSPSVERGGSLVKTRSFSPVVGFGHRSQSVDQITEIKPSLNCHTKFSKLLESLPEKPFSPPSRMLSRSKSLSVEKEMPLSKPLSTCTSVSANDPFLPTAYVESPQWSRRGRSVSDPLENMPEPISFSSPVVPKTDHVHKKFDLSNLSTDNEGSENLESSFISNTTSLETEMSVTGATTTEDNVSSEIAETDNGTCAMITDSEVTDISQNIDTDGETTETIVVMTESGESLSEEDAIKIVKEIIEQRNSSLQTENVVSNREIEEYNDIDPETLIDNLPDDKIESQENNSEKDECKENNSENDEYQDKNCEKNECQERSSEKDNCQDENCGESANVDKENLDSPFIPQIENENSVSERVRRKPDGNKEDNIEDKIETKLSFNTEKETLIIIDNNECESSEGKQKVGNNVEQMKEVSLNIVSDTDSDIVDITESVVNAGLVAGQCEGNSSVNTCNTNETESKDNVESMVKETRMKRIVYDLDESVDSDIEILDDLNTAKKDEKISEKTCENELENIEMKESEKIGLVSTEFSDNTEMPENTMKERIGDAKESENKSSGQDDEIDGDSTKPSENVESVMNQITTSLSNEIERKDSSAVSSDMKQIDYDTTNEDEVVEQEQIQHSEKAVTVEDKEMKEIENSDENLDSSKEEVLRGLGLGTLDEVEKLKNSPQKSPSLPILAFESKKKYSKKMPVKSYPLRKNTTLSSRIQEKSDAKLKTKDTSRDEIDGSRDTNESNTTDTGKCVTEFDQSLRKELSPELPVLDPIAKKIKEESIAKSCPEDKGPFKCSKCRRQYRTETSYLVHIENCNFLVSSSDDEDNTQDEVESKDKTEGKRKTRSIGKNSNIDNDQKRESICSSDDNTEHKRTTLRRSTQFQRVAIEVAEKRQQEEENPKRGRGRPPLKHKENLESDKEKQKKEHQFKEKLGSMSDEHDTAGKSELPLRKGKGRPRKSEIILRNMDGVADDIEFEEEKVSVRELRRKSRETKILENLSQSSDSEQEEKHVDTNLVKRKRGRPRKVAVNPEVGKHNISDEEPLAAKRKLRNESSKNYDSHSVNEEHETLVKCADFQKVKDDLKSQIESIRKNRYRPAKMVHMKTKNKTIRIYVKDRKKAKDGNNKFGLQSVLVKLHKSDKSDKKELNKVDKNENEKEKSINTDKEVLGGNQISFDIVKQKVSGETLLQKNITSEESEHNEHSIKDDDVKQDQASSDSFDQSNEKDLALSQNIESSDEDGDILDESTGLIIDKRTGEAIRSPTQNMQSNKVIDQKPFDGMDEGDEHENNENNACENKDNETKDVFRFNSPEAKDKKFDETDNCMEVEDVETEKSTENINNETSIRPRTDIVNNETMKSPRIYDVNNESMKSPRIDSVNNETVRSQTSVNVHNETKKSSVQDTVIVNDAQGAVRSLELKDVSENLPSTVLKLLKDGHKVVIKNPKLNKCFMWQRTADGYIGKPFNKGLAKSPPGVIENTDKSTSQPKDSKLNNGASNLVSKNFQGSNAKIQTASDILQERKKIEAQMHEKQNIEATAVAQNKSQMKGPDVIRKKAQFVVQNIERLIETNLKAKAKYAIPERMQKGSAEYVGGILISTPKSVSHDEVKQTIQNTAPLAANLLQNTLIQNKVLNNYQGSVQHVQDNFAGTAIQTAVHSTVPVVSHPLLNQQLQTGSMGMYAQTDLQTVPQTGLQTFQQVSPQQTITPAGYSTIPISNVQSISPGNQQFAAQLVQNQVIQQTYQPVQMQQVQQIPSLEMGLLNIPIMTSVGFSNAQLVQAVGTMNQNGSQQYLNTNTQLINTQSSSPLIVNHQMSQSLLSAHSPQSMLNQYVNQPMISPQPSQSVLNQFVNQAHTQTLVNHLSPQSQVSLSSNQLGSQAQASHSVLHHLSSHLAVSQSNSSQQATSNVPYVNPRPVYNQTQIINKPSGKEISNQNSTNQNVQTARRIIKTHTYSILKEKLASQSEIEKNESKIPKTVQYFNLHPGLGGGSSNLIEKMSTYLALKHKNSSDSDLCAKRKKTEQIPEVIKLDTNGFIQKKVEQNDKGSSKKQTVKKHKKVKTKLKKEVSPRKWRRPYLKKNPNANIASGIALPHKPDKASHPMIHGPKEVTSLPVAAAEEEVRDVPLTAFDDNEGRQSGLHGACQNLGHLEYEITSDDGFSCRSDSLDGAWKQVTEKVQDARTASRLKHLSYAGLTGVQMFGLSHPSVVYLVEQLYGASYCRRYKFKYHRHEIVERELELVNPTGCIRTEPFNGRNPTDMFSFLMSRYRRLPEYCGTDINEEIAMKSSRRATSMDLPMAMRFRKLKGFSKECVGVYRSTIHGRGLFCKRSIDAGEMIIEYAGEVIRNSMTDIREKYYESKGIGCYMFRIDDTDVVDATMKGSAARFINHSCDPNCYSKVITVDNRKHIVIFAMRKILRGEELTYDYKFPIEEIKIPCTCGAKRCRRYLN